MNETIYVAVAPIAASIIVACVETAIALGLFPGRSPNGRSWSIGVLAATILAALCGVLLPFGSEALGMRTARLIGAAFLLVASVYLAWQLGLADAVANGSRDRITVRPPTSFARRWLDASFWGGLIAGLPVAVTWAGASFGGPLSGPAWSLAGVALCCVMGGWLGRHFTQRDPIELLLIVATVVVAALGEYRLIEAFS